MLLRVPSPQRHARLRRLILQVFLEDRPGTLAGNFVGRVILVQQMRVVFVAVLVIGGDIVIVGVVGLQVVFFGLSVNLLSTDIHVMTNSPESTRDSQVHRGYPVLAPARVSSQFGI